MDGFQKYAVANFEDGILVEIAAVGLSRLAAIAYSQTYNEPLALTGREAVPVRQAPILPELPPLPPDLHIYRGE